MKRAVWIPLLLLLSGAGAIAQDEAAPAEKIAARKPIQPADYGRWESLGFRNLLSPDGRWLSYSIRRGNGEDELCLRMLATDSKETFAFGGAPTFSADSKWFGFSIGVSRDQRDKLAKSGGRVPAKMGLHDLVTGKTTEIDHVASFNFSDDGRFLVMRHGPPAGRADVVVRNLETGVDTSFGNVTAVRWIDDGTLLAMVIGAANKVGNGVRIYDPATGHLRTLRSSATTYRNLTWREDADDLAVFEEVEYDKGEDSTLVIHAWRGLAGDRLRHRSYDHLEEEAFSKEQRVVSHGGLRWSSDGAALFFGVGDWDRRPKKFDEDEGEPSKPETEGGDAKKPKNGGKKKARFGLDEDDEAEGEGRTKDGKGKSDKGGDAKKKEKPQKPQKPLRETLKDPAGVEVWHAGDVDIIPVQKRRAGRDRNRHLSAVWWIDDHRVVTLSSHDREQVSILDGDRRALVEDNTPYEELRRVGPRHYDVYSVDARTGDRQRVLESSKYHFASSPNGAYCLFLEEGQFWSHDLGSGARRNLTGALGSSFVDELQDNLAEEKRPYGIAGWTEDASHVFLYDRYDLWMIAPDGSGAERLTRGAEDRVRHRRLVLDFEEEEWIDPDRDMYLSLSAERTKKSGFAKFQIGDLPGRLVWLDKRVGRLAKAKDAPVYVYSVESFSDSPDLFVADANLDSPRQVTETNAFQSEFLWGRSELVDFESDNGDALQGALFYPADYEPGRQYPMIVNIYERLSQSLHRYSTPSERSPYNPAVFTARGYFVYMPDIVYRPQNPGLSAVECVVPAVKKVLESGMVDPERVGLMGHSWGAYQTAFIVTQTDVFAAGVAGAPLTNMMSMSMSVYWNSGTPNVQIFHESQGRMNRAFWRDTDTYIKNSPIFSIDRMDTPLLVAFGDKDGAVDFNQGVELYNAARVAQKQLVMLVYPGENHGLRQKPNQVDYHYRLVEWFGHYLRGDAPEPWITDGMPHLERQKELEELKRNKGSKPGGRRRQ